MKTILQVLLFTGLAIIALFAGMIFELVTRPYSAPLVSPLAPRPTIDREAVIQDYKDTRFPPWAFETLKVGSNQPSL
jgi:hypothetical protein